MGDRLLARVSTAGWFAYLASAVGSASKELEKMTGMTQVAWTCAHELNTRVS